MTSDGSTAITSVDADVVGEGEAGATAEAGVDGGTENATASVTGVTEVNGGTVTADADAVSPSDSASDSF